MELEKGAVHMEMEQILASRAIEQPPVLPNGNNKLTVVIAGLALGGAERIVLDWAMRVHPKWQVNLVVLRDYEQEWSVPSFIKLTRFHGKNIRAQLQAIGRSQAASGNPTCVCHLLTQSERDALSAGGAFVVPVLHNAHNGWLENVSGLAAAPYAITVSLASAEDLRLKGWTKPISTIHHIPKPRKFAPQTREAMRAAWNIPVDATVIGMIGAVKPQKNYTFALRVLGALHRHRDAYLVILGGPIGRNGRAAWESIIREIHGLGLRHKVAMPGFVEDAIRCLPAFDVLLNTSHYEGLSMAMMEAMVNRMPVVASKVGGQSEMPHEGLTLVALDTSENAWAQALDRALESRPAVPAWSGFPSHHLWTLAQLARSVKQTGKVLFVTANLNSGGAQRSLVNLAVGLVGTMKFEIAVTGNSTGSFFFKKLEQAGVRVHRSADSRDAFDHAEALVQQICSEHISTVCFWNLDPKIKLLLVKTLQFAGVRFVDVSPGNNSFDEMEDLKEFQQLICFGSEVYYKQLDTLVLKYNDQILHEHVKNTVIIPNGVPKPRVVKQNYSITGNPRIVVNGRIAPRKFLREILMAMRIVWETIPVAELHIFGGAEPRYQQYAQGVLSLAEPEINSRVFFHGADFQAASKLHEFDAYVVLGKDQGCPNALLEALVAGLPAIANDDGGTREQVINEWTGLLLADTSPQPLARAIVRILQDRELAQQIGQAGHKHVMNVFSMTRMIQKYKLLLGQPKFWRVRIRQTLRILAQKARTFLKPSHSSSERRTAE